MRRKLMAGLAAACFGVVIAAGPASAVTGTETFHITFSGNPGSNLVSSVVASGVVNGAGTDRPVDQLPGADRITLPGGTITVVTSTPPGGVTFDPRSCVARVDFTNGSYVVVGGTGAYQGASGGGTYAARAVEIFKRTRAGCSSEPLSLVATFTLSGPLTLP
jgi:hypothetical protein